MRTLHVLLAVLIALLAGSSMLVPTADARLKRPHGVVAKWDGSKVKLRWKRVPGARSYLIGRCVASAGRCRQRERAGKLIPRRRNPRPRPRIFDRDAPKDAKLGYTVVAVDRAGRRGRRSRIARVVTKTGPGGRAPAPSAPLPRVPGPPGGTGNQAPPGESSPGASSPPPVNCSQVVGSVAALQSAAQSAAAGTTVCIAAGSYPSVRFSAARSAAVTIAAKPGATVTFADLDFGSTASHLRIQGVHVDGQVKLEAEGAHHITFVWSWVRGFSAEWGTHDLLFEHNDIRTSGGGNGVELISTAPVHGAPGGSGTQNLAPVERVTIRANKLHDIATDAIFMGNYRDVLVEDNEISGLQEAGQHTDALQSVYGGKRLTFRGNYVHDNRAQGFFVKDGRAYDLVVHDNLFVHTRDLWQISFYDLLPETSPYGIQIVGNTVWDSNLPFILDGTENRGIYVHNNVFQEMLAEQPSAVRPHVDQDYNLIGGGFNWGRQGPHDVAGPASFVDPASDDYRLRAGAISFAAGVSWRPADKHFGP